MRVWHVVLYVAADYFSKIAADLGWRIYIGKKYMCIYDVAADYLSTC